MGERGQGTGPLHHVLAADLPLVLEQVELALQERDPDFARFLAEHREEVARAGERALEQFLVVAERARADGPSSLPEVDGLELTLFEEIGRAQWREGRSLARLLAAYQTGARVAWRRFSRTAADGGLPAAEIALLAEAVFAFVDGLSSASARGYVEAQGGALEERQRARTELVGLLLTEPYDAERVRTAAAAAGWPLPEVVTLVLLDPDDPAAEEAALRLGLQALPVHRPGLLGAVLPGPDGTAWRAALAGVRSVLGPAVPPSRLPAVLRLAEVAGRLQRSGVLPDDPLVMRDHLDALVVHQDARLLEVLRDRALAPLDGVGPEARQRLEETLAAWLRHQGSAQAVAAELHVHRQTVRYRLGQLRELFGTVLDDPDGRLRLTLALGWGAPAPGLPAQREGGSAAAVREPPPR